MIKSNKIGLGTVQFGLDYGISNKGGKTNSIEVERILETAKQNRIDYLDTASGYGSAEEVLGQNNLDGFRVVSKFMPPSKENSISKQLDDSLKKLNQNKLYAYLAHRPMALLEDTEQWNELQRIKIKGKVQKIGFSLNEPNEIIQLLEKGFVPDIIQVPYNYFDRRFDDIMIDLKSKGCEIHTRSTFLQGLFFMDTNELPSFFDEVKPYLKEVQKSKTLPKSLLHFVLNKSFIDSVIIGVENNEQLLVNIDNSGTIEVLPEFNKILSKNILMPMYWPK